MGGIQRRRLFSHKFCCSFFLIGFSVGGFLFVFFFWWLGVNHYSCLIAMSWGVWDRGDSGQAYSAVKLHPQAQSVIEGGMT